jgi:threonine synthase
MRGKQGVRVFMLSPHGRMSPFQQAQMFSLQDANIHNIAIEGVFDDCQDIVKAVSNDLDFKRRTASAPSTRSTGRGCWPRWSTTSPATSRPPGAPEGQRQKVSFAVPSGNFGNICAGHVARMMGLPIDQLVLATNENDVLDEFFRTGTYRVRGSAETHETSSPSMDISKASNFERFVFDLLGRDGARTAELFGRRIAKEGGFTLTPDEFAPAAPVRLRLRPQHARRPPGHHPRHLAAPGVMIDTHTADGLKVAREHLQPGRADAGAGDRVAGQVRRHHPAKRWGATIRAPAALQGIEALPKRFTVMPVDAGAGQALHREPLRLSTAMADHRPLLSLDEALASPGGRRRAHPITDPRPCPPSTRWAACWPAMTCVSALDVPPEDNTSMDGYALHADRRAGAGTCCRCRSASRPAWSASRWRRARRRASSPAPRCRRGRRGGDAGAVRGRRRGLGACASTPCPSRASGSAAAARTCRTAPPCCSRQPPDAAGAGPGRVGGCGALHGARKPRVALFSTGDELVMPGEPAEARRDLQLQPLHPARPAAGRRLRGHRPGHRARPAGRHAEPLRRAAAGNDLILTSGGVSTGEEDHIRPAVQAEGWIENWQIAIKPGKPLAFGACGAPTAARRCSWACRATRCRASSPSCWPWRRCCARCRAPTSVACRPRACRCGPTSTGRGPTAARVPARALNAEGALDLFDNQSSGVLTSAVWADGLVDNPGRARSSPRRHGALPALGRPDGAADEGPGALLRLAARGAGRRRGRRPAKPADAGPAARPLIAARWRMPRCWPAAAPCAARSTR